jgi:hypothetical protein
MQNLDTPSPRNGAQRHATARKILNVLQKQYVACGNRNIAEYAQVSETMASRWFGENLEALARAIAYMDLKIVPSAMRCVKDQAELDMILYWAKIGMNSVRSADDLLFDEPE